MKFRVGSLPFVLGLGALTALPPLSIDASLPAFPETARALGVPPAALQATLGSFMLAFALGQLVWGPLVDRYGRRATILTGLAFYAVAGGACAFAHDATQLIAARFAQGFAACASTVGARAMIRDLFRERERAATMQGYVAAAMSVAPIVAPLLGAALLAATDWRGIYVMLSLAGFALVVVALGFGETLPRGERGGRLPAYAPFFRLPRSGALAVLVSAAFAGQFAFISGSPFVLVNRFHLATATYALAFAGASAAFIVGTVATGRLARGRAALPERLLGLGVLAMPVVGGIYCAVYFGPLAAVAGPSAFVACMAAYAFAAGLVMPNLFAIGLENAGSMAGIGAAVLGSSQMAGGAIGSSLVGAWRDVPTHAVGFVVLTASVLAASAYVLSRSRAPGERSLADALDR